MEVAFALIIVEETHPVVACETVWTFPGGRGGIKMHVQWRIPASGSWLFLRGFVDDNKLGGGSTFLEEVAGKTIVRNARRKSPPGKQIRCILAMVIWWKIVPSDLGLDFAETFPM
jgi:hypothetical protein